MLFVTTVPDVNCPCFVYYVWGRWGVGGCGGWWCNSIDGQMHHVLGGQNPCTAYKTQ